LTLKLTCRLRASTLPAALALLLYRWALHRAKGTEHAAIAHIGTQQRLAALALVVELAGIGGHSFPLGETTMRAGQHRFKNDGIHRGITCAQWPGSRHSGSVALIEKTKIWDEHVRRF
jgi:hypothetical protein